VTRELSNIAASVYTRLRTRASERREEVRFVHQRYAAERLLYRLMQSPYRNQFILRGGMLYEIWGGAAYRPTNDLDLLGYGSSEPDQVQKCFRELSAIAVPDDGLRFQPDSVRVRRVREDTEYGGVEVRLEPRLHTARIYLKVDVGFGDVVVPGTEEVDYPTLLDGPAPRIRIYPPESVVAEKFHVAVLFGDANTRLKDFYDLFVLSRVFSFKGVTLTRSIAATFARRRTALVPGFPLRNAFFVDGERAKRWRSYLTRNELSGAPSDFGTVGEELFRFLGPPYEAMVAGVELRLSWRPGGPWQ
jgi:predicted nucleotidyltransferase component of viral defense system